MKGNRELWIDGTIHIVTHPVWAHVQFLSDLNSNLAARCAALAADVRNAVSPSASKAAAAETFDDTPPQRWTPAIKEAVINRAKISDEERARVIRAFELTEEELSGWITAYAEHGLDGLKVRSMQVAGARR